MSKECYVPKNFSARSVERINRANAIIAEYAAEGFALTLRQLYYQFVARGLLANTVQSYKTLGFLVNDARLAGLIDWSAVEDRTRNVRINSHWESPQSIVRACASQYQIDKWADQPEYVEVWIEKDALIGVIEGICEELDVPYFSCRGYTSQSEMRAAASQRLVEREELGKLTTIIHLGDHDPSGIDMTRDIQARLRIFGSSVRVDRLALNMDQVDQYGLPPNPAKVTDSRYLSYVAKHGEESWELDAIDPPAMVSLTQEAVENLRDDTLWQEAVERENEARRQLRRISRNWERIVGNHETDDD